MLNIIENIKPTHASIASISAAVSGEVTNLLSTVSVVDTAFQHCAWFVAILAGVVSIVNGVRTWFKKRPKNYKFRQ